MDRPSCVEKKCSIMYRWEIYRPLGFLLLQGNVKHGNLYGLKQKQGVFKSGAFFPALMLASLILNFLQSMEFIWDMKCVDSIVVHMLEEQRFSRASRGLK